MKEIKVYILNRLEKRNNIIDFNDKIKINKVVDEIVDADERFIVNMDATGNGYSNDEEYDFVSSETGYSTNLVELILWQRYCYEMENDFWEYPLGECRKCGSSKLYLKEVENTDFADKIICKTCGVQFINE